MFGTKKWTEDEIKKLKKIYPSKIEFNDIVKEFPLRTANAIRLKASRIGLKRPLISDKMHPAKLIVIEKDVEEKETAYIFRCDECKKWIRVKKREVDDHRAVLCDNCGAICYFD
jgi:hypothetical protein